MIDGYKSPITLIFAPFQDMVAEQAKQLDDKIYEAIVRYDVQVDKEELLKALEYDRDQYHKGYNDAKMDAVIHAHWNQIANGFMVCSHCEEIVEENRKYSFCPLCGAQMDGDTDD